MSITRRQFIAATAASGLVGALQRSDSRTYAETSNANDELSLAITGDLQQGYGVEIRFRGDPIARHNGGGEFSALFQNADRSLEDRIENWHADSHTGNEQGLQLHGKCKLANLNATVFAQVEYRVVAPHVVRKRVRLHQVDAFELLHQITNSLEPVKAPASFWSFDQADCKGGALHEYFPAAGFRTKAGVAVGLLTDSGWRNQWSRLIRRDGKPVKPSPRHIPDVHLYQVCRSADRARGQFFVKQCFGEALVQSREATSSVRVTLPAVSNWRKSGDLQIQEQNGTLRLLVRGSDARAVVPFAVQDGEVYALSFKYRSSEAFSVQLWDIDERSTPLSNITLYNDRVPRATEWAEFRAEIFVPALQGAGGALFFSQAESDQATRGQSLQPQLKIEVRELELRRVTTRLEPYHRMEIDQPVERTSFIFVDENVPNTLRGYRLASERYLADGLGFKGGDTEKVLYSDLMMLCWPASMANRQPIVAPSIWYSAAGEMYMRDSFFALNGIHNRELNERVFDLWGANQGEDGAINTLVEPNMANLERKSNDSTPLWLMWGLQNRVRFQTNLPIAKIRKAAEYCLRTYDRHHDGSCWAQFVMGQLDVIDYPEGTSDLCENQGTFAVTLRVIKALGIPGVSERISDGYIEEAERIYRSYYHPDLGFLQPTRDIKDAIGFGEIFPEFLSLWLFGRKMLTDEMVTSHLERIPVLLPREDAPHPAAGGTVRPIFIGLKAGAKEWAYFTEKWHPMISNEHGANYANHNMDGIYYNGGSWMRIEICGYVTGKLHGWTKADQAIQNRLWAETNVAPEFPTSQEYLATDPDHPFFGYHRVFAWNAFVLRAMEVAGLRTPEMDPDYAKPRDMP
jgi:hypothetical protein